jgi:hypothetical protein
LVGKVVGRAAGDIAPEGFDKFLNRFFFILVEAIKYRFFMRLDQLVQLGDFGFQRCSIAFQNDPTIGVVVPDKPLPYRSGFFADLIARHSAIVPHELESSPYPVASRLVADRRN